MSGVAGVVLAAGAGARFAAAAADGVPKPLARFRGRPLVEHALAALDGPAVAARFVVLGAQAGAVVAGADLRGAEVVRCAGWAEGLSASLRAGVAVAAAAGFDAVVIVLADQPLLSAAAVARVVAAREPARLDALRASYDGVPAHPTLLEASTFAAVAELRGDAGARQALATMRVAQVACDELGRPDDVDVPADLARLEAVPDR
jgi:CTP:molybdopterin cytidylyltransferase MocA